MNLISLFSDYVSGTVERSVKLALAPLAPYLRKLGLGLLWIILAAVSFTVTLLGIAGSIFLAFSQLPHAWEALATGGVFLILGLLFLLSGILSLRPPRY